MIDTDRERFATALLATFEVYGKELSDMVVKVWWASLKPHNIDDVCSALTKHISDPERGQFPPKPADVIRFMATGEKEQLENLKFHQNNVVRSSNYYHQYAVLAMIEYPNSMSALPKNL